MNTYYTYLLLCADNSFYTGVTNNIERRFEEHNIGLHDTSYTYSRRPVKLVWFVECNNIELAISYEKQIKGWSRKKKIALIKNDWDTIIATSNEKNLKKERNNRNSKLQ